MSRCLAGTRRSGLTAPNSHASPTPILDGERVYVHFGADGTACLSAEGKVLWSLKLPYKAAYGPSSSPVLYKDLLIIPCQGAMFVFTIALDKETGKEAAGSSRTKAGSPRPLRC